MTTQLRDVFGICTDLTAKLLTFRGCAAAGGMSTFLGGSHGVLR